MKKEVKKICIISGPNKEVDLTRGETAINYSTKNSLNIPFKILGAGPDLEKMKKFYELLINKKISEKEYFPNTKNLDHHFDLYNLLMGTPNEIETVTKPTTLVEDIFYGFSYEEEGVYGIVTEPWHYKNFEFAQNNLKYKGRIPRNLEFFNIPSKDINYYNSIQKILSGLKTKFELAKF